MNNRQITSLWSSIMVEELIRQGAGFFCISPGSRSTPLTIAIARNPKAQWKMFVDERSAAFFALGYGRATGRPAVLVCTSGTAVANYLPAVVEA
ncbi:MAG: thiamine pyrophosphate-binding protein, partial [Chlorobiaceae bacterium]